MSRLESFHKPQPVDEIEDTLYTPKGDDVAVEEESDLVHAKEKERKRLYKERIKAEIQEDFSAIAQEIIPEESYLSEYVDEETGEVYTVFDLESLQSQLSGPLRYKGVGVSKAEFVQELFRRHEHVKGISTDQLESGDLTPKPLFYYPKSAAEGTNPIAVVDSEFHASLWDLAESFDAQPHNTLYPTKDGSELRATEVKTALTVFREYDARRDLETEQLLLRNPDHDPNDPESPIRVPISRALVRRLGLRHLTVGPGKESQPIQDRLPEECPHLLENGSLRLEDFPKLTVDRSGEFDSDFALKEIPRNGFVMLGGVRHYIGKAWHEAGAEVRPLSQEHASVYTQTEDGRHRLDAIFSVVPKEQAKSGSYNPQGQFIPRVNSDQVQMRRIDYKALAGEQLKGEPDTRYQERVRHFESVVSEQLAALQEQAQEAEEIVRAYTTTEDETETNELVTKTRNHILQQAEQYILTAVAAQDGEDLEAHLQQFNEDARTYLSLLKTLGPERFKESPLQEVGADRLSEDDRNQMREILSSNYSHESAEFQEFVLGSFEAHLYDPTTDFYILRDPKTNQIVSFNRFDTIYEQNEDGAERQRQYFGSFNARSEYYGVGSVLLEETLQKRLETTDVMSAHCDPTTRISQKYIEDGFVATQAVTKGGKILLEIWRSQESGAELQTKRMSAEELTALADKSPEPEADYFVRTVADGDNFHELDEGLSYLLTRYFTVGDTTYAAYELDPAHSREFTEKQPVQQAA